MTAPRGLQSTLCLPSAGPSRRGVCNGGEGRGGIRENEEGKRRPPFFLPGFLLLLRLASYPFSRTALPTGASGSPLPWPTARLASIEFDRSGKRGRKGGRKTRSNRAALKFGIRSSDTHTQKKNRRNRSGCDFDRNKVLYYVQYATWETVLLSLFLHLFYTTPPPSSISCHPHIPYPSLSPKNTVPPSTHTN